MARGHSAASGEARTRGAGNLLRRTVGSAPRRDQRRAQQILSCDAVTVHSCPGIASAFVSVVAQNLFTFDFRACCAGSSSTDILHLLDIQTPVAARYSGYVSSKRSAQNERRGERNDRNKFCISQPRRSRPVGKGTVPVTSRIDLFDGDMFATASEAVEFIGNVLESSTEYSLIATDSDGVIQLWNEGARRLYGHSPADVVGQPWTLLHTDEDLVAGVPRTIADAAERRQMGGDARTRAQGWQPLHGARRRDAAALCGARARRVPADLKRRHRAGAAVRGARARAPRRGR